MYPPGGEDYSWSVEKFKKNFRIQIHENEQFKATFSLVGIDASIANAFRRILLAEIPTLAIETVYITNNTSVVQDEVLASRLGLIPLKGGKYGINQMTRILKDSEGVQQSVLSDYNTVVMHLDIECKWRPGGPEKMRAGVTDVNELYENPNGELCCPPTRAALGDWD
jgi:DNA-directed RNA polymerase I and III subunit RPAC1